MTKITIKVLLSDMPKLSESSMSSGEWAPDELDRNATNPETEKRCEAWWPVDAAQLMQAYNEYFMDGTAVADALK
jgi:hypothetical protein